MTVGYTEIESQGFIVSALDHSGYLYVDPVDPEHTEEVGLDSIPKLEDIKSQSIFRALAFIATSERVSKTGVPLTPRERQGRMQRLSMGLGTLRAIGEELSGTPIDQKQYTHVNQHYRELAVRLDERGTLPRLQRP